MIQGWGGCCVAALQRSDTQRKKLTSKNNCSHCKQVEGPALAQRTVQNIKDFVRNRELAAMRQAITNRQWFVILYLGLRLVSLPQRMVMGSVSSKTEIFSYFVFTLVFKVLLFMFGKNVILARKRKKGCGSCNLTRRLGVRVTV